MKVEAQQSAILAARTTDLSDPRIAVLTAASDPADHSTWVETTESALAGANRPVATFGTITNDDANNKHTVSWPASTIEVDCPTDLTAVRLAIVDGTGSLATAARSISDAAFSVTVSAGGKLKIPANSQVSSEQ